MSRPHILPPAGRTKQSGMALAVALILLLVVTLVGLAATRGTTTQQKMTANFYDREIAFQNAEAGLRMAEAAIPLQAAGRTCIGLDADGDACGANPFTDPKLPLLAIQTVLSAAYAKGDTAAGQPQYVIEDLGNWDDPELDTGFDQTFNANQYGAQGTTIQSQRLRVTARSSNPGTTGDRSTVTLQAYYKR